MRSNSRFQAMIDLIGFAILLFGSGECLNGCNKGFAGPNCSYPCPDNCKLPLKDGEDTCNFTDGECLLGCNNGYAGPDCTSKCPDNCLFSSTNESGTCNFTSGECLHGCAGGFVGSNCSIRCPENCASSNRGENMCEPTTGECLFRCKDGFYGAYCNQSCDDAISMCRRCSIKISDNNSDVVCNECIRNFYREDEKTCYTCSYWCRTDPSFAMTKCRENDGYCNIGCSPGRYGFKCEARCSSTCKNSCHRKTGYCEGGCKYLSYCGPTCENQCQDGCSFQHCNQTCNCVEGCKSTYWGEQCRKVCAVNCANPSDSSLRVCSNVDGKCIFGCDGKKFWRNQCDEPCSNNCGNGTCEQDSGNCTAGCTTDTVFGLVCDKPCNENCIGGTCERADGYCKNGCKVGKYGIKCNIDCSRNCLNDTCIRETGHCTIGCKNGFYGNACKDACSDKCLITNCERESGNCTDGCVSGYAGYHCLTVSPVFIEVASDKCETSTWRIVGIVFGTFSVLLAFYAVYVTIILRWKNVRADEPVSDRSTEHTYYNKPEQYFKSSENKNESAVETSREDDEIPVKIYTDLVRYSKDDKTYDIIQNN